MAGGPGGNPLPSCSSHTEPGRASSLLGRGWWVQMKGLESVLAAGNAAGDEGQA